ncbi:galectin-2 [Salmo salar]|uniref:Galectin n=1 Tax=Salmo salar TaxID=8030 RepID=B5XB56_SALSA|nr:galectin-2 [Salmo salar]ACI68076.1 Galectin-2 [Salmo salar]ACN09900.1 Galectin-2 [Salmo salar]ACN12247.1 Galectin-2 [Salmo salar]|eukprot:XP_014037346.1 PREDICTED: galectin-2-like [Salmo salar]
MPFRVEEMSFKQGQEMTFTGKTKSGASSFSINIGHDSDNYALHFNPRFSHEHIVCNSLSGGSWGDELKEGHFPFQDGEQFKLVLNFTNEQFYIKLPDGHMMDFPNRLGDCKYNHIMVDGDVKVISFKVK